MSRGQQLWTMTVQSYLSPLKREISRNGISFPHPRIALWAVNMKDTQSAVLEHVIMNAPVAWAGERTFLMPSPPPPLFRSFSLRIVYRSTLCKGLALCLWKDKEDAQLWCRAGKCTTKWPGYWKVSSAFLFRRITRSGRPHTHLQWGLSYKVNPDMKEPQSRKKNKTKLPSNGDVLRPTDGTCTCKPPGKQVVRDRRVTIHTQEKKPLLRGPETMGPMGGVRTYFPILLQIFLIHIQNTYLMHSFRVRYPPVYHQVDT